jgi:hypothetical protein
VQVQPGQSRSGQAGSECCHSPGDWRVRSVHSESAGREGQLRNWPDCDADVIPVAEGGIGDTVMRGVFGVAGVASPGHADQGTSREPRRARCFSAVIWARGDAQPKGTWSAGGEGGPRRKRTTLKRSVLLPRGTGGAGRGR